MLIATFEGPHDDLDGQRVGAVVTANSASALGVATQAWQAVVGHDVCSTTQLFCYVATAYWHLQADLGGPLEFRTSPAVVEAVASDVVASYDVVGSLTHLRISEPATRHRDLRTFLELMRHTDASGQDFVFELRSVLSW